MDEVFREYERRSRCLPGGGGQLCCPGCLGVLTGPVTGACGHTACRRCWHADSCPRCHRFQDVSEVQDNVLIKAVVSKWWPRHTEAAVLRTRALQLAHSDLLQPALQLIHSALSIYSGDHLALEVRSELFYRLNRLEESLQDAELMTKLKPLYPKGYLRKGLAMAALGHYEEAFISLSLYVSLDKSNSCIKHEVTKMIQRLVSPAIHNKSAFINSPLWPPDLRPQHNGILKDDMISNLAGLSEMANMSFYHTLERVSFEIEKLKNLEVEPCELELGPELVDPGDFDCVLCCRILWRPVTTPCGHTYCSMCLDRCLDYNPNCPLCITPLHQYLSTSEKCTTEFVERALLLGLPREYRARLQAHHQEVTLLSLEPDVPVFVCTTAYPTVSCPLFVFEPRYRLMVRRAIASGTRTFAMAPPLKDTNPLKRFANYGTMLEIKDWVLLSDGCSILSNIGVRRFRVVSRGERDGYDTARVQYLSDEPIPESSLEEVIQLHDQVLARGRRWFKRLIPEARKEIMRTFGDMPLPESGWHTLRDGPSWTWWLLAILPFGPLLQVGILGITCLEKRLRVLEKTLKHLDEDISSIASLRPAHSALVKTQMT